MSQKLKTGSVVNVPASGTRVALSSTELKSSNIVVQAASGNTNKIYVGDSTVTATNGISLEPGQTINVTGDVRRGGGDEYDLSDIFVDADTNDDKVRVMFSIRP